MRFMGLPSAQNMHGGPYFRHILRKFTGLKEGVGENIPNTGRVIVSASRDSRFTGMYYRSLVLGDLNDVILLLDI